eukprot:245974-Pyramimonas_sp.AAC.1
MAAGVVAWRRLSRSRRVWMLSLFRLILSLDVFCAWFFVVGKLNSDITMFTITDWSEETATSYATYSGKRCLGCSGSVFKNGCGLWGFQLFCARGPGPS